ncbi:MAG: hypothetical protein FJ396_06225 [Verrucomicrobia bacterium]|nr:hypothetical protein [Verrucomicrobiota bacterium]
MNPQFSLERTISIAAKCCLAVPLVLGPFHALRADKASSQIVQWWLSTEDRKARLERQPDLRFGVSPESVRSRVRIEIDETANHQSILGLGSSFEHSTCHNLSLLPEAQRERVIQSLVDPDTGIGMSLMRICIGTSDFAPGPFYTYDDMPDGQVDPRLERFSIDRDRDYVLPVIKLAQRLHPELRFFASPWTPPTWMKTNRRIGGGSLRPECYPFFAEYLVRFLEAYRREGVEIDALTVQNEPEFGPTAYPSCLWTAIQQRDFIRDHLGPLIKARGLKTTIWAFDHNFNNPGFPATILKDPAAAKFVSGSAFHLYEGRPEAMSRLHREFPDKALLFSEGSVYGAFGGSQIISYFRNWAGSYNAWVTMIDRNGKPNISGFHECSPTIVVLDPTSLAVEYRSDYYLYGQFMRFIRPGAVRIGTSSTSSGVSNVGFRNPDGRLVVVVANTTKSQPDILFSWRGTQLTTRLAPLSVATLVWKP